MAKIPLASTVGEEPPNFAASPGLSQTLKQRVLAALGCPPRLHDVIVRPLWGAHYRVNVFVGSDVTLMKMVHSYFVAVDEAGEILSSVPPIRRLYPDSQ